jgi:hypothetical protein
LPAGSSTSDVNGHWQRTAGQTGDRGLYGIRAVAAVADDDALAAAAA